MTRPAAWSASRYRIRNILMCLSLWNCEKYGFVVISSGYHNTAEGKHSPYRSIIPLLYKNFIACDKADTEKAEKEEAGTAE